MLFCFSVTGNRPDLINLKDDIVKTIHSCATQPKKWYNYLSHLDLTLEESNMTTTFKDSQGVAFAFIMMVNEELIVTLIADSEVKTQNLALSSAKGLVKSCISMSGLNYTEDQKSRIKK